MKGSLRFEVGEHRVRTGLNLEVVELKFLTQSEFKPADKRSKWAGVRLPMTWGKAFIRVQPTVLGHIFTWNFLWDGAQVNPFTHAKQVNWKGEAVGGDPAHGAEQVFNQ